MIRIEFKFVYLLLVALTISINTVGQETKIGAHFSTQFSWLKPEAKGITQDGMFLGINGGLEINKYFKDNYAINTGISIGNMGGKLQYQQTRGLKAYDSVVTVPSGTSVKYKLQYVTIPLGLKLKTNEIGYFSYYVRGGITGQVMIKSNISSDFNELDDASAKDEIGLFNFGYHFGLGIEYAIGRVSTINFEVYYYAGLLNIAKESGKLFTHNLPVRIGIIF